MSSLPRTFRTTLTLSLDHGSAYEVGFVLSYRFEPGYPDSYDEPGQADAAEILSARIALPGDVEVDVPAWLPAFLDADEDLHAALVSDAREGDAAERAAAAEARWDEDRLSAA